MADTMTPAAAITYALGPCDHGKGIRKDCSDCMRKISRANRRYVEDVAAGRAKPGSPRGVPYYAKRS